MTSDPVDVLDDLAGQAAEEFEAYRQPDEFKDVSLVIDNNDPDRPTLIVHVDRGNADTLADEIEAFLQERGLELSVNDTRKQMPGY
jgi:flavodoxin